MAQVTATMVDRVMAIRVMAIMAAMPLRITAATPQRTTTTATPPLTTADTGLTMVVPCIGALFAPHTPTTALGTIAGIAIAGDRQRRPDNERSRGGRGLFRARGCLSVHSERRDDREH